MSPEAKNCRVFLFYGFRRYFEARISEINFDVYRPGDRVNDVNGHKMWKLKKCQIFLVNDAPRVSVLREFITYNAGAY